MKSVLNYISNNVEEKKLMSLFDNDTNFKCFESAYQILGNDQSKL